MPAPRREGILVCMNIEVRIISGQDVTILQEEEISVVPAGDLVIAVTGSGGPP